MHDFKIPQIDKSCTTVTIWWVFVCVLCVQSVCIAVEEIHASLSEDTQLFINIIVGGFGSESPRQQRLSRRLCWWNRSGLTFSSCNIQNCQLTSKIKYSHTWLRALGTELIPRFLGSQPAGDLVINPVVGCCYFPPGPRLLSQPKRSAPWPVPNYSACWRRHTGVSSLSKPLL